MTVAATAKRTSALATAIAALWIANLGAQSGGKDLPVGFRSIAGVTLNRDSAATIRAKLGIALEQHVGAGHDVDVRWCYIPAEGSSSTLLELLSDAGDMGTPGHALTVIRLRAAAPLDDRAGCSPLRSTSQLSTPAGLRLGLSAAAIQTLLGRPTRRVADSLIYDFDAKEYFSPGSSAYEIWNTLESRESCFDAGPPYANVQAMVIVVFRDGRADEIRLERNDQSVC